MKTFTIDADNNISVFTSKQEAAAASATPFDPFASQSELAELAAEWPMSRLVEIWNSIPGVTAVSKFTNRKVATERIWKGIQGLGATALTSESPVTEPVVVVVEGQPAVAKEVVAAEAEAEAIAEIPEPPANSEPVPAEPVADAGAQVPDVAPVATEPAPKPARQKKAPKAPKKAAEPKTAGVREGSKTATVIALLQRPNGATLEEIMSQMGWQKHTVRGFMAGAMKKAGHTVESFKSERASAPTASTSSSEGLPSSPARLRPRRAFLLLCARRAPRSRATTTLADTPSPPRASQRGPNVAQP